VIIPVTSPSDVRTRLRDQKELLDRYAVASVSVFGSVARGEATPDSDVDLLIEFARPVGAFEVIRLERELASVLGRTVDLVTLPALKPRLRDRIVAEAVNAA
jgi:predicted nucleotidyltransferase